MIAHAIHDRSYPIVLLLLALLALAGCKRTTDTLAPPVKDGTVLPAPKEKPDGIPVSSQNPVTFAAGCSIAVIWPSVWDLQKNKVLRELEGPCERHALRALSANGRWFATGSKSPNQTDTAVSVWSVETGKTILDVPGKKDA